MCKYSVHTTTYIQRPLYQCKYSVSIQCTSNLSVYTQSFSMHPLHIQSVNVHLVSICTYNVQMYIQYSFVYTIYKTSRMYKYNVQYTGIVDKYNVQVKIESTNWSTLNGIQNTMIVKSTRKLNISCSSSDLKYSFQI